MNQEIKFKELITDLNGLVKEYSKPEYKMQTYQELSKTEKIKLSTTEIAKRIKQQLKQFKGCKFSVSSEYYSMGSSITIALIESDFKVIKDFKDIPEKSLCECENRNYNREQIKINQENKYHQLNKYTLLENYNKNWCNGVFLTEEGHNLLKEAVKIAEQYNYDNSDSMTDYYDVNFGFNIWIGKWNKEFKEVA